MRKPAPRRGRPRSAAADAAILDTAIALIRERGYDALTMEQIATRAAVGKTTVYRRWKTKEMLVSDAIDRLVRKVEAPDTGSTEGDLLAAVDFNVALYRDPATHNLIAGLVAAMARSARIARVVRKGFVSTRRNALRTVLRRGVARGDLRADTNVDLAIDLVSGPLLYRALVTGKRIDKRLARLLVDTIRAAFGAVA